jgi:hypothetical protein
LSNLASQEGYWNRSVRSTHYGASTGRLLGSGILAALNGMSVTVEAWVFGAFLRIASAAASKIGYRFFFAWWPSTLVQDNVLLNIGWYGRWQRLCRLDLPRRGHEIGKACCH